MAGWELSEGEYVKGKLTEDEMWAAFGRAFSSKTRNTTTYKYGFLKSILDNLYNTDSSLTLTFDQLFSKFAESYWNLILKYHLHQSKPTRTGKSSKIEQLLLNAGRRFGLYEPIPFESLSPEKQIEVTQNVKAECSRYVVGALYEDLDGILYGFSKKKQRIQLNPEAYSFVCSHQILIEKLNYYEWAKLLESVNQAGSSQNIILALDESSRRHNLDYYRSILFEEFEARCFYCGKKLDLHHADVDHFVPWSFVKDDQIWNMVLACPSCNRRKSDHMPDPQYLDRIIRRNEVMLTIPDHHEIMQNYSRKRMLYLYDTAIRNGFDDRWTA